MFQYKTLLQIQEQLCVFEYYAYSLITFVVITIKKHPHLLKWLPYS